MSEPGNDRSLEVFPPNDQGEEKPPEPTVEEQLVKATQAVQQLKGMVGIERQLRQAAVAEIVDGVLKRYACVLKPDERGGVKIVAQ